MDNNGFGFLDAITIISFLIGVKNFELNTKQASDLEKHLSMQDNDLLQIIIDQNNKIIELLGGMAKND